MEGWTLPSRVRPTLGEETTRADSDEDGEQRSQSSRNVQHEAKWRAMGVGRGLWVEVWIVVRSFYEALWGVGYVSGDPVAEMRLGNLDKKQDNTQNRTGGGRMEEES
ncbi:hypothetical protein N7507_008609 [Penicillium longicatenatum]|nr:hypothetical protein N7507_008609 [Penicillium longicatenatum]